VVFLSITAMLSSIAYHLYNNFQFIIFKKCNNFTSQCYDCVTYVHFYLKYLYQFHVIQFCLNCFIIISPYCLQRIYLGYCYRCLDSWHRSVCVCISVCWLQPWACNYCWINPDAILDANSCRPKDHVIDGSRFWCHLANTIERSVLGGDKCCRYHYCINLLVIT